MIIIDTNVISELMRLRPEPAVISWFAAQSSADLFLTTVNEAELRAGVANLPPSRRRDRLAAEVDAVVREDFSGRVLPFDSTAARAYAVIAGARRSLGRPILEADLQIAAIAHASNATVATRNSADFVHCGIALVDPWTGGAARPGSSATTL